MRGTDLAILGAILALGCGGAPEPAPSTAGAEPEPQRPTVEQSQMVVYGSNPVLNMYVQGPDPDPGELLEHESPESYHAEILVTNTGNAPVNVEYAVLFFEVYRDDEAIECEGGGSSIVLEGPEELRPGRAHSYEARMECPFPGPGEYEVRAYMSFGADVVDYDVERHYVGSYRIRVR